MLKKMSFSIAVISLINVSAAYTMENKLLDSESDKLYTKISYKAYKENLQKKEIKQLLDFLTANNNKKYFATENILITKVYAKEVSNYKDENLNLFFEDCCVLQVSENDPAKTAFLYKLFQGVLDRYSKCFKISKKKQELSFEQNNEEPMLYQLMSADKQPPIFRFQNF